MEPHSSCLIALVRARATGAVALGAAGVYATTREDELGKAARSVGAGTAVVSQSAYKFNKEHNITGRAQAAAAQAASGAYKFNEKHRVTQTLSQGASQAYQGAARFDEKHDISGKAVVGASKVAAGATTVLKGMGEFNQKHHLTGRASAASSSAWQSLQRKLAADDGAR